MVHCHLWRPSGICWDSDHECPFERVTAGGVEDALSHVMLQNTGCGWTLSSATAATIGSITKVPPEGATSETKI